LTIVFLILIFQLVNSLLSTFNYLLFPLDCVIYSSWLISSELFKPILAHFWSLHSLLNLFFNINVLGW
jgi:hypothetical protein